MARLGRPARLFSAALVAAALCATAAALAQQSAVVSNLNGPQPVPPPLTRLLQWHSWDGQQVCSPRSYTQPTSEAEIVEAVQRAAARGHSLKVVGSGHSFSAIALGDDPSGLQGGVNGGLGSDLLNLDYYRAAELDAAGVVTVQAGIRVFELNTILDNANRALPNLGAISQQSVAGATSTSTHGTGAFIGSMSTTIVRLRLVLANGTIVTASRTENPTIFAAARAGLGALGIISTLSLQTVPAFNLQKVTVPYELNTLLGNLPSLMEQYERLQWYWFPYNDSSAQLLLRIPTSAPITGCWPSDSRKNVPASEKPSLLDALAADSSGAEAPPPAFPNASSCVDKSFKALTHAGDDAFLYTETEWFVPVEYTAAVVAAFRAFQATVQPQHNASVRLFTGVRYVAADDVWLSPMYGRNISVVSSIVEGDATVTGSPVEFKRYEQGLAHIAMQYGGRPHPGKQNWANASYLKTVYPKWDDFLALRAELDPSCLFANDYLRRYLGVC